MDVDIHDGESFAVISTRVDLRECFPDEAEYQEALVELQRTGRYWGGGGAAPLVYLTQSK